MKTKDPNFPTQALSKKYIKGTDDLGIKSLSKEKYCLWINEAGHPTMDIFSMLAEKVPFGGYVLCLVGNKTVIERLLKRLLKKPCLIEKYIKTLPE